MADHDQSYKLLFSHPEMVADLIRGFVREPWVESIDFATLERVGGSYVSEDLRERRDDMVWRASWGAGQLYVYLLLEFQSEPDRWMALRLLVYVGLLLQDLAKELDLEPADRLPPVLPLVLYNGTRPWNAAQSIEQLLAPVPGLERYQPRFEYLLVDEGSYTTEELASLRNLAAALFRLEQSRGPEEVEEVVSALAEWLSEESQQPLRRHFLTWLSRVLLPGKLRGAAVPHVDDLGEFRTMLEERVQDWAGEWERHGIEKGIEKGIQKGIEKGIEKGRRQGEVHLLLRQIERRFGPPSQEVRDRVEAADEERVLEMGERLLTARQLEDLFA